MCEILAKKARRASAEQNNRLQLSAQTEKKRENSARRTTNTGGLFRNEIESGDSETLPQYIYLHISAFTQPALGFCPGTREVVPATLTRSLIYRYLQNDDR